MAKKAAAKKATPKKAAAKPKAEAAKPAEPKAPAKPKTGTVELAVLDGAGSGVVVIDKGTSVQIIDNPNGVGPRREQTLGKMGRAKVVVRVTAE